MSVPAQITVLLALTAKFFDGVVFDRMTEAEHAVQKAAANIPAEVSARLASADKLSDEDRKAIIESPAKRLLPFSLFRAAAEALASENASRLAAMQRADKNINDLLEQLQRSFHQLRQSGIDEELFDVISGFEALVGSR